MVLWHMRVPDWLPCIGCKIEVPPDSAGISYGGGIMAHMVHCVKFNREMPGLDEPPFDNELGQKVYDNVSQEAWRMWMEHCKMLLNEYRLQPWTREAQDFLVEQMNGFFFDEGGGGALPKEYVAPSH